MFNKYYSIISTHMVESIIFVLMIFMWYYILDRITYYIFLLAFPVKSTKKNYQRLFDKLFEESEICKKTNMDNMPLVFGNVRRSLEKNMAGIRVIVVVAPMLGLMGTVWGMLVSFNVISQSGLSEPGLLAEGISGALSTTQWGLVTAIPGLFALGILERLKRKILMIVERHSMQTFKGELCKD